MIHLAFSANNSQYIKVGLIASETDKIKPISVSRLYAEWASDAISTRLESIYIYNFSIHDISMDGETEVTI